MNKPRAWLLVAIFFASAHSAVLAQESNYQNTNYANYQSSAPTWPQQAPQGYETPQYDAYRGQAQQSSGASGYNYQQPIQPESNSATRAMMEQQQPAQSTFSDKPIKPEKSINTKKIKGAVGGIGRTLGHVALPVAGLGALYMVTRAATRAGMMGGMGGYGMGGMGMGGYGMRGYGW
ncbi:MAG TPA: hypothetical protein V6C89_07610 [Drouetiella sp.]|jgi:hypothetical protein